jgi:hypothetical protein
MDTARDPARIQENDIPVQVGSAPEPDYRLEAEN